MEDKQTDLVHLHRIDAAQNMRRFYLLTVQPTLFGGASVIRNWGRIGSGGQTMMETFDKDEDANMAISRLERLKRRRGYRDARGDEWPPLNPSGALLSCDFREPTANPALAPLFSPHLLRHTGMTSDTSGDHVHDHDQ